MLGESFEPTNEERRVVADTSAVPVTVPSRVTPDTPLGDLNLNWSEKDLPERERTKHVHRLHPYLGKFIPQLVEVFLRKYFRPGQTVLDPFAGSGTTLVQANELGVHAVGYDVSAFNVLLMEAKTRRYDLKTVRMEVFSILEAVEVAAQADVHQPTLWDAAAAAPPPAVGLAGDNLWNDYLRKWFAPQALRELLTYRDLIPRYEHQGLLKVILSRAARSARLTTHYDLDFPKAPQTEPYWCYKHNRVCLPTTTAARFLRRYGLDAIRRLEDFAARRTDARVTIRRADSRTADLPPVDGVITSPPYVGLIDYHEQHRYAYELLGLEDFSPAEIGAARQGAGQKAQREYQEAVAQVFQRVHAALPSGGRVIVVAGDKYDLYGWIAHVCGFASEAVLHRRVNRRTGRRASEFYESIFIWRKP